MNILFLITSLFFSSLIADEYFWPNDYEGMITTTFSEPRFRRFHAGIDIRTYGEIGSNIYAVQDGYISRINIKPYNYGKAIYLTTMDGNIVLYAHLDKFNPEIEILVKKLHKKYKSSFFNHYLSEDEIININKGDIIGYTGDTGTLSGPHIHFEIRNKNHEPLNPLKNFYNINDTQAPIAKSISFIPLKSNTWINGKQDYVSYDLLKINDNKYVLQDTIALIGDFGIAVETYDMINKLNNFKFGIYEIQLLLDNILMYSINFDKYNFSEDNLIYTEIDYKLLKEGKISHRLFNKKKNELSFINSINTGIINLDNKFHNLIINIADVNNNKIQIQGVLIGEIDANPNIEVITKKDVSSIKTNQENVFIKLCSKYDNIGCDDSVQRISNNEYLIKNDSIYDVIEFYSKNKKGIESKKSYLTFNPINPLNIKGDFNLKYLDAGLIIEFIEDTFSGGNPKLEIKSNDDVKVINMYRKEKNILSTNILKDDDIEKIKLVYNTNPEIIFEKKINIFNPKYQKEKIFNNYKIIADTSNFYFDMTLFLDEKNSTVNNNFSKPITIYPYNIPFKELIPLSYNINECSNCNFYKYNDKKNEWEYVKSKTKNNILTTNISSGGMFCILEDKDKPIISNLFPNSNSTYKQNDLNKISFNLTDITSNIDPYKIKIELNNTELYFDYIPYRELVNCHLDDILNIGKHLIEITAFDNSNNKLNIISYFQIIE